MERNFPAKERDDIQPLSGNVQLDDAYLGGERRGGKRGRGAAGKTPFVASVQTNEEGHPIAMRLSKIKGFRKAEIAACAQRHLHAATLVVSDGLSGFTGITTAGCEHEAIVTGGGPAGVDHEAFLIPTDWFGCELLLWHTTQVAHLPRRTVRSFNGGAAALGALGYRAYQNWQAGKPASTVESPPVSAPAQAPPKGSGFLPETAPASDGRPFELALIMAMIAAANADGHIGPEEHRTIFDQVGQLFLDAEDKAFVFDTLGNPPSLQDIASLASGPEQAAEIYLASRLAIDPDHPAELAYLDALASRLSIPSELVAHLESQAVQAT